MEIKSLKDKNLINMMIIQIEYEEKIDDMMNIQ
jgi:hypothetical protein